MDFTFNGNRPDTVTFNGNDIETVKCNGVIVWQKRHIEWSGLTFTAAEAGSTIKYERINNSPATAQYSYDTINWYNAADVIITLNNIGDEVYFKGYISDLEYNKYSHFVMTGLIEASGDILSMNNFNEIYYENNAFIRLFENCTSLLTAPELPTTRLSHAPFEYMFKGCTSLIKPPTIINGAADFCCYSMFEGCTSLTTTPKFGNYAAKYCYNYMFKGCTSLVTASKLPATRLADECYEYMFGGCTSLVNAPELPATTLAGACYRYMFVGCKSLVTAPELPATTLAEVCYFDMFDGCNKLNKIICLATDISALICTQYWLRNVSSTGTFVTPASTPWTTGENGIPSGWTRVNV